LFSAVINLVLVVVTLISILAMIFADDLVLFLASEKVAANPELLPLTTLLMRIMLVSTIIFGVSGVVMAALNARQHFFLPALAPTIYTIGIIGGGAFWILTNRPVVSVGFAVGTVAGALGHLLIQLPGLKQKRAHYNLIFTIRDRGVIQVLKLMAPRVLGLSFSEINKFVTVLLTDMMLFGSLPALGTAFRLIIMPQGIIGQALGIAAFPTLASLAVRSAFDEMRQILSDSLRILLFLGLPATVIFMLLGEPIVTILFQWGRVNAEEVQWVTFALFFYALGLIPLMALEVTNRTFYALSDTLTPVLAGGVQIVLMWALSVWFSMRLFPALGYLSLGGLALGFSLSNLVEMVVLLWLLRGRIGGINGRSLFDGFWRMAVATVLMSAVMLVVIRPLSHTSVWLQLFVGGSVGAITYLGACYLLRLKELHRFLNYGLQRIKR
jgi:putative peptidoglycan lipid II flippase